MWTLYFIYYIYKMNLVFKARIVSEIENERRQSFVHVISDFSMKTILLFVRKGLNVDESKAIDEVDNYLASGGDLMKLYLEIIEVLENNGFLAKSLEIGKNFKEMLENPQPLQNTGDQEKKPQSF